MQKYTIKKGTTSKIIMIDIYDSGSTVGARLAGLVFNSASLSAYYNREGAAGAATAITLATATKGTWATGGFIAIDATNMPGHYELHIPDAALATGANSVMVELKGAANMVPKTILIELVDNVEADTYAIANHTTYGNAALNTDLDTLLTESQSHPTLAEIEATTVLAKEATLTPIQADTNDIQARIPTALVGGRIDASIGAVAANAITAAGIADGAIDRATFAADTGLQNIRAGTAQAGAAASITLDASASAVDSFYNECWVYITGGIGVGQTRAITAYVGATKVATITPNWITNPDATSTFAVMGVSRSSVGSNLDKTGYSLSAAAVTAIHDEVIEGTLTHRQIKRLELSALAGKSGGGGTATLTFRDNADLKARITATVDANGNRTAMTLDGA